MSFAAFTPAQFRRQQKRVAQQLFRGAKPQLSDQPRGILLGGQPAAGKTALITYLRRQQPDTSFVVINGDEFRAYHPHYRAIYAQYGTDAPHHTQPFSNAMVEWVKAECIANRYDFIIEGTMRTFGVIGQTVSTLKGAGYQAELHALAIPRPESLLGIFARYERDMTLTGQGRFSAIAIHDEAYHNIPVNLQRAAHELPIDRLAVYSRNLANETVVCLDTADLADLTTLDLENLFAQVRRPQRDADFYRAEYERLRESARQRGETNATYLTQLTTLADLLA